MNTIVFYKSTYGSSKLYADWLAKALQCQSVPVADMTSESLLAQDVILYVGGLYAGSVNGFKQLRKYLDTLQDKSIVLCIVGLGNPAEPEAWQKYYYKSVPKQYRGFVKPFFLRGNQLFSEMSFVHRLMMNVPKAQVERIPPAERTSDQREFLNTYGKDVRFASREAIGDVVAYVQGLEV